MESSGDSEGGEREAGICRLRDTVVHEFAAKLFDPAVMLFERALRRRHVAGEIEIADLIPLDGVIESALRQSRHGEQLHSQEVNVLLLIHLFILSSLLESSVLK
jgi:hypothetical protein